MLLVVAALTFVIFRVLPTGNPALMRAGRNPTPQQIKAIEAVLGLDKSLPTQFWDYIKNIFLHFDFGYSYGSQESVLQLIKERLPATISLTVGAVVLWIVFGMGIGILSALRRHSVTDRTSMGGALLLVSAPEFWLGLVLLYLFSSDIGKFKILPGAGSYVGITYDPWKWFTSLLLPWFVLAAGSTAVFARLIRGNLLEVMDEDYIRTARAKGLPEKRVVQTGSAGLDQPGRDPDGSRIRDPAGRGRAGGDGLQHPRRRPSRLPVDRQRRLRSDRGHGPARRDVHHRDQHRGGHPVRVPRSPGPLRVSAAEPLLRVEDLRVEFHTEDGVVGAVDGITYQVLPGKTLGIVGESGSGKTVSSLTVLGLTRYQGAEVSGRILFEGRDLVTAEDEELRQIRGNEIAMIFQDPLSSLHPAVQGRHAAHRDDPRPPRGLQDAGARARRSSCSASSASPTRRALRPVPARVLGRHAPARDDRHGARATSPKLLIADEPTTALDVTIQAQILDLIERLQRELGMAILIITHDLGVVAEMADDMAVMYAGQIVEAAPGGELFASPEHPYTWGLLRSIPRLERDREEPLVPIPGTPPSLAGAAVGLSLPPPLRLRAAVTRAHRAEARTAARSAGALRRLPAGARASLRAVGRAQRRRHPRAGQAAAGFKEEAGGGSPVG